MQIRKYEKRAWSEEEKKFRLVNIIAIILIGLILGEPGGGFEILIKFSACCIFAYYTWHLIKKKELGWAWLYGSVVVFLNPFIPIISLRTYENRDAWAVALVVIIFFLIVRIKVDYNKKRIVKKKDLPTK